jgi:branched-chain amino acid transport system ATP-binding protein
VMRLCSTIHVLDRGRLIASGTPDEVRASPEVISAYIGDEAVA